MKDSHFDIDDIIEMLTDEAVSQELIDIIALFIVNLLW